MEDTVDQAHSAVPRTLADIHPGRVPGPYVATAAPAAPTWACSFSGTGPDELHLASFARARLRGPIGEADMAAVLAPAGTCSPTRRSSTGARGERRPAGDAGLRVPDRRAVLRAEGSQ